MKKLFLIAVLSVFTLSVTSCSDDDSGSTNNSSTTTGTFSMKVDGVTKSYNTIVVNDDVYAEGTPDEEHTLSVTASNANNLSEVVYFNVYKGDLGPGVIYNFTYTANGHTYYANSWEDFTTVVQTNSNDNKLKGSFSGVLYYQTMNGEEIGTAGITEGMFDIKYVVE